MRVQASLIYIAYSYIVEEVVWLCASGRHVGYSDIWSGHTPSQPKKTREGRKRRIRVKTYKREKGEVSIKLYLRTKSLGGSKGPDF